ncbi:MAG: DUF4340 domain-containing protein [Clostridiales bacterium]|nr:DUF4340 domain-containing protein [Clostridiales bacterium]
MRKKQMITLLVILIAVVAALLAVVLGKKHATAKQEAEEEAETVYVGAFDGSDVTGFSFYSSDDDGNDVLLAFELEDGSWVYSGDPEMETDADTIDTFLGEMGSVSANSVIEGVDDISEYGIDDPAQVFTVDFSDGSEEVFTFGAVNEIIGGYYLQVSGDDNVYLVNATVMSSTLNKSAESFAVEEEDEEEDLSE